MGFVEDKDVDLVHFDETIQQTMIENFCRANNDHVLVEPFFPCALFPEIGTHGAVDEGHVLIEIVPQDCCLLIDESDTVRLSNRQ